MFNALACFLYLSSASYLAFSTKVFLLPEYYIRPGFDVYPAMTAAYVRVVALKILLPISDLLYKVFFYLSQTLSGFVGVLHGIDAYFSYVHYRTGG